MNFLWQRYFFSSSRGRGTGLEEELNKYLEAETETRSGELLGTNKSQACTKMFTYIISFNCYITDTLSRIHSFNKYILNPIVCAKHCFRCWE